MPGKRLGAAKTVFVLTAKLTFSGSEEFTYNLKNLKRATIIGETTGGGTHPVSGHCIEDHFTIGVPVGPRFCMYTRPAADRYLSGFRIVVNPTEPNSAIANRERNS